MSRSHDRAVTVEQTADGTYRTFYDTTKGDVTVTLALALEEVIEMDVKDVITEFTEYADPDALDHLFRERPDGKERHPAGCVHLVIDGIDVTIHSDGLIELDV